MAVMRFKMYICILDRSIMSVNRYWYYMYATNN
jgi:hypothetical protein